MGLRLLRVQNLTEQRFICMPRYRITVEYDGRPFVGWQRQANGPSVQGALRAAIENFCGELVHVQGAGRTDAGVHALGQVAHFDLSKGHDPGKVRDAINYHLKPDPIAVLAADIVPPEFNARFGAYQRHYRYRILNRRSPATLDAGLVWEVPVALNADTMQEAAQHLVGCHDFTTFRAAQCQAKSPIKNMNELRVERRGNEIEILARAPSFLHNQVRSIVGTLKKVGEGKWTVADVAQALAARDRAACGPVAPPEGLYLVSVDY